jgi:hypothetical protein
MPIRRYVGEGVFTPKAISEMSKALADTAEILGVGSDEKKSVKPSPSSLFGWPGKTPASMRRPCVIGRWRRWEGGIPPCSLHPMPTRTLADR